MRVREMITLKAVYFAAYLLVLPHFSIECIAMVANVINNNTKHENENENENTHIHAQYVEWNGILCIVYFVS